MAVLRVSVVQVGYGDDETVAERVTRVSALVRATYAAHPSLDLIVLPELWAPTGFGYDGWEGVAEPVDGPFAQAMAALAGELGVLLHAGTFVERLPEPGPEGKSLANTALVCGPDGSVLATYRKMHRFGFGAGEPVLMEAGRGWVVLPVPLGPHEGEDANAATGARRVVKVGLATCYDLRFPELFRLLLDAGAEVFVVPAAWPAARVAHWTLLGQARAIENQCVMIQCNTGGTHRDVAMGGRSQVVAATGEVLGELAHGDEGVLVVDIDLETTAAYRRDFPVLSDRRL